MELDPITINNPTGEAWRQCKMGAREMMMRELVRNAIEACMEKPPGERLIRLYGTTVVGMPTQKLAIWNRGGMNLKALLQFSNINAAIDKRNAVDGNFGRGAKIAAIMSNLKGLRFRSCSGGSVLEVTLAADPVQEVVGRVEVEDALNGTSFVRDVTSEYPGQFGFLNTETDWTEVVLCGNEVDQDTTRVPYLDANLPQSQWLFDAIGMRFFDVPAGVDLSIHSSITRHKARDDYFSRFFPMRQRLPSAAEHSSVPFDGGVVHYIQAPDDKFASNYATKPFGGVIWKNEIHYLHSGSGRGQTTLTSKIWPPLALTWGLVRAYGLVSILVEIDEDAATHDILRVDLKDKNGARIDPAQFADIVRDSMPEWVKKLERSLEPKEDEALKNIREHLRELMREFKNQQDDELGIGGNQVSAKVVPGGQGGDEPQLGPGPVRRRRGLEPDNQDLNAQRKRRLMDAPEAKWCTGEWFDEQGHKDDAAFFHKGAGGKPSVIYFNEDHDIFRSVLTAIANKLPEEAPRETVYDLAKTHAERLCYMTVGTHVVAGLSLLRTNRKVEDVLNGLGAIVLTTAMATARYTRHFRDAVDNARRDLKARIISVAKDVA